MDSDQQSSESSGTKRKDPNDPPETEAKKPKVQVNRGIYITNLPLDTTEEELEQEFGKYGMIDRGIDGKLRIRMYEDKMGQFNGEALIVYFKKESIMLATQMMDDYEFRPGDLTNGKIRVSEADLSYKKVTDGEAVVNKMVRKDKKAAERQRADMMRRLADWSDNEEDVRQKYAPKKNKWAKVAIIKHAFTLKELEEDDEAIIDIKDDMRQAAEKYGDVTNVTLFDKESDGILTVRFKEFESAESFCRGYDGKSYAYQKLEVRLAEDKPKFSKSKRGTASESEDEVKRLEQFINERDSD